MNIKSARFRKVGIGYYELTRQIRLKYIDGREEIVDGLFEASRRDDGIRGWNLCVSYRKKNDGEVEELSNYAEVYSSKREIASVIRTGVLDRWTRQPGLGWCL